MRRFTIDLDSKEVIFINIFEKKAFKMIQMPFKFLIELFGSTCFSRQRAHSTVRANFLVHELITQEAQKVCWQGNISGWKNVSKHILHLTLPASTRSSWMLSSALDGSIETFRIYEQRIEPSLFEFHKQENAPSLFQYFRSTKSCLSPFSFRS